MPTLAAAQPTRPSRAGDRELGALLVELGQRHGTDLLFDQALVRGLRAKAPPSRLTMDAALRRLLAGTNVGYRRTADGAFILYSLSEHDNASPERLFVPEILVVGKKLQNVDIRRTPNDVQPYRVLTASQIAASHRDNVDQFLRARLPANGDSRVMLDEGRATSSVDLRGVGVDRTLILIDGRRLPRAPFSYVSNGFYGADLNPVPLNAINRIETLTSTAGGIYGPGATGGVVNVVLNREYRGIELIATTGIADRGDAARMRLEGRIGLSTPDDRSQLMLFGSYENSAALRYGDRDYTARARALAWANDPTAYLRDATLGHTDAIHVFSATAGNPLVLKPEFGGVSLGSDHSYLPMDFTGTMQDRATELLRNAGKLSFELSSLPGGRGKTMVPAQRRVSAIFSARQALGDNGSEIFVDGLYLSSHVTSISSSIFFENLRATSPGSPFARDVTLQIPSPAAASNLATEDIGRVTAGAIIPISANWRASADITFGRTLTRYVSRNLSGTGTISIAIARGTPSIPGAPPLLPLLDWQQFVDALESYYQWGGTRHRATGRSVVGTARLAGPVVQLAGGPVSASLQGEWRKEHFDWYNGSYPRTAYDLTAPLDQRYGSIYGELHVPLIPARSAFAPLRGLELQLAARLDTLHLTGFRSGSPHTYSASVTAFTAGAKIRPLPFLTLRGSYATGSDLPTVNLVLGGNNGSIGVTDPKRGGQVYLTTTPQGGSPDILPETGNTIALGLTIEAAGARLSLDYSRIAIGRQINDSLTLARLMAMEERYPDRITRAALTEADRLAGYTVGKVTLADIRSGNFGSSVVHALDINADWRFDDGRGGTITPYAAITWQPSARTRTADDLGWSQRAGYADGPLKLRGHGGVTWTRGQTSLDLNVQYLAGHWLRRALGYTALEQQRDAYQGRPTIPPQLYMDLAVRRTFTLANSGAIRTLDMRLGILNIFDRSPPIVADPINRAFDGYGDPRRRRVELVLAARY